VLRILVRGSKSNDTLLCFHVVSREIGHVEHEVSGSAEFAIIGAKFVRVGVGRDVVNCGCLGLKGFAEGT